MDEGDDYGRGIDITGQDWDCCENGFKNYSLQELCGKRYYTRHIKLTDVSIIKRNI